MKIFGMIILVIIAFAFASSIVHVTYYRRKLAKIKPYGELVDVNGEKMHVYSMGKSDKTIVILPGMGVALPSAEYSPLMRKLSEKFTVVCLDYFGVGFSDETSTARTCENYVKEIRFVLKKIGLKAPYVLMPHSVSSIFSEYYAAKYPQEVEEIISLDGTPTVGYQKIPAIYKSILKFAKFQQSMGLTSVLAGIITNKKNLLSMGYTKSEIEDAIVYAGYTLNDTIIDQIANSCEFIKETEALPFPRSVPYFKIIAKKTYETPNKQLKMTPQEYQQKHLDRIGEHAQYEVLEGDHFIYRNNLDKIAEITEAQIQKSV